MAIRAAVAHTGSPPVRSGSSSQKSPRPSATAKKICLSTTDNLREGRAHVGHRAKDRGSMGRRAMAAAIIYRQMLPSSAFFALFPRYLRNPGPSSFCLRPFRSGFQILGLLIYTYETKQSRLKITGVFGDLRAKRSRKKRGVRNAVGRAVKNGK